MTFQEEHDLSVQKTADHIPWRETKSAHMWYDVRDFNRNYWYPNDTVWQCWPLKHKHCTDSRIMWLCINVILTVSAILYLYKFLCNFPTKDTHLKWFLCVTRINTLPTYDAEIYKKKKSWLTVPKVNILLLRICYVAPKVNKTMEKL